MGMKRFAWTVRVPWHAHFTMAGEPCTREEALHVARSIWPDAEIVG